jgi:hypothetical protein
MVEMYRAIPKSALRVAPNAGHGPVFFEAAAQFVQTSLAFFRSKSKAVPATDASRWPGATAPPSRGI